MSRRARLLGLIAPALPSSVASTPTRALMTSALTGLLGVGAMGCSDDATMEPDPLVLDASSMCSCPPQADAGPSNEGICSLSDAAFSPADAATPAGPMVTQEMEGNRTFAEVKQECDQRAGYTQVHAACSGVNSCAGFSYGDWEPGVTTEHTCAGMNGCNGISCVVLPADGGKTGKEVYEAMLPETGPRACANCHADWSGEAVDLTKFKVYFMPGEQEQAAGRTLANWLEKRSAAEQARMVAFGSIGRLPDGSAFSHMSPYHKVFSRAEIERAVQYVRTQLQPVAATIKVSD